MKKRKKARRSTAGFTTLDRFLKDEGKLEEFEAVAVKEVLAWQIGPAERAELDRRWAGHLAEPGSAIPWQDVRRKLRDGT